MPDSHTPAAEWETQPDGKSLRKYPHGHMALVYFDGEFWKGTYSIIERNTLVGFAEFTVDAESQVKAMVEHFATFYTG